MDRPSTIEPTDCKLRDDLIPAGANSRSHGHCLTSKANESRSTGVLHLLYVRSPSHIAGLIVPVVVYPFEGVLLMWAAPNVTEERLEARSPALADLDPSAPVPVEVASLGVIATLEHSCPCQIFRTARHSMGEVSLGGYFTLEASAGQHKPSSKVLRPNYLFRPAIAAAMPTSFCIRPGVGFPPYGEPTKSLPTEINNRCHHRPAACIILRPYLVTMRDE